MSWLFKFASARATRSRNFAMLTVALGLLRVVRKMLGAEPRTIYKHELKAGEVLVVSEPRSDR